MQEFDNDLHFIKITLVFDFEYLRARKILLKSIGMEFEYKNIFVILSKIQIIKRFNKKKLLKSLRKIKFIEKYVLTKDKLYSKNT